MDPVTGAAIIGAGASLFGGKEAGKRQDKALSLEEQKVQYEQQRAQQLQQIFSQLWGKVDSAAKNGMFDPNARVEKATERFNKNAEHQQRSLGAGLAAAGYKPTDSEVKYNTNRLGRAQVYDLAQTQDQAAKSALSDELNAYRATDPSLLTQAGQMFGNSTDTLASMNYNIGQQNQPNLSGLFQNILPFLNKRGNTSRSGWGSSAIGNIGLPGDKMNSDGSYGGY